MTGQNVLPKPGMHVVASAVKTSQIHLATLLGTLGCVPGEISRGPGITPRGDKVVSWTYQSDNIADEIVGLWQEDEVRKRNGLDPLPFKQWEDMTRDERRCVVRHVAEFAGNLKHFIKHTKEK